MGSPLPPLNSSPRSLHAAIFPGGGACKGVPNFSGAGGALSMYLPSLPAVEKEIQVWSQWHGGGGGGRALHAGASGVARLG